MDSGNFFGFDASLQPDDDYDKGFQEGGDEYDVLNDETFGSAATRGDWEQDHQKLSTLAQRTRQNTQLDNGQYAEVGLDVVNDETFGSAATKGDWELDHQKMMFALPKPQQHSTAFPPLPNLDQFDALSIKRQIQDNKPTSHNLFSSHDSSSFFNGTSSSPLGDSIWSSPPNAPPTKWLDQGHNHQTTLPPPGITMSKQMKSLAELELEVRAARQAQFSAYSQKMEFQEKMRRPVPTSQPIPVNSVHANLQMPPRPVYRPHQPYNNAMNRNMQLPMHHPMFGQPMKPNFNNHTSNYNPNNTPMWNHAGPHMQPLNYNQRSMPGRPDEHLYHNGIGFNRPNFNNYRNDRRPFEHNSNYNQLSHSPNASNMERMHSRVIEAEWDEWHRKRLLDEYSGLMTPRERGWVRNIQLMQLTTENPYRDDYYFMMMKLKKQKKQDEEIIKVDGYQFLNEKSKDGKEYSPPSMEKSLGKLQVLSVHAPRKIVDLQVVHLDPSCPTTPMQKEMRKHRHTLLYIEKLCNIHIELDDLKRKIRGLGDCPTRDSYRAKCAQLVAQLWKGFSSSDVFMVQVMSVRKGKTLVARLLNWLKAEHLLQMLKVVLENLSTLHKKDVADKNLSLLWPTVDRLLSSATFEEYLELAAKLTPQLTSLPSSVILECPFGWSVVLRLLAGAEQFVPELSAQDAWQEFLLSVICTLVQSDGTIELTLPSVSLTASADQLAPHLSRCTKGDPTQMRTAVIRAHHIASQLKLNTTN